MTDIVDFRAPGDHVGEDLAGCEFEMLSPWATYTSRLSVIASDCDEPVSVPSPKFGPSL